MKNKLILISGPTASGKTNLALKLAREFNGEIISADSRQVYQGMDIVTGKDIPKDSKFHLLCHFRTDNFAKKNSQYRESDSRIRGNNTKYNLGYYLVQNIPIWGLDLVKPDKYFDVSDFVKIGRFLISHIQSKNKIPIIVGGTAFWLKNLLSPAETIGVPTDKKLRQELEKLSLFDLQEKLKKINSDKFSSLNNSDINNPRRLIRAIEVSLSNPCHSRTDNFVKQNSQYQESIQIDSRLRENDNLNFFWLSLNPDPQTLQFKISNRVEERIKNGAIKETQTLSSKYSWQLPSMSAIGYKDLRPFLSGEKNLNQATQDWVLHEIQYAKRQLTFLKKLKQINSFDLQESDSYDRIKQEINKFIFY